MSDTNPMDASKRNVSVSLPVDEQFLADVIITACEGGINYWANIVTYDHPENPAFTKAEIIDPEVRDDEEDPRDGHFTINLDAICEGIKVALDPETKLSTRFKNELYGAVREQDAGDIDADLADIIVQCAIYKEVLYS